MVIQNAIGEGTNITNLKKFTQGVQKSLIFVVIYERTF